MYASVSGQETYNNGDTMISYEVASVYIGIYFPIGTISRYHNICRTLKKYIHALHVYAAGIYIYIRANKL